MRRKLRLVAGLPRDELIRRIAYHARREEVSRRALGFYLLDMQGRGAFRPEARSAEDWAVKKLGLELRVAREVLSVARALEELPRTDAQLSRGRIAWTAARWIAEVATAKTERAWLRYARRHTYAELRAAVRKAKGREGARPGDGLDCERAAYAIHLRVPALDHEVFERALKKMLFEIGPRATPREALRRMAEIALRAPPPPGKIARARAGGAGEGSEGAPSDSSGGVPPRPGGAPRTSGTEPTPPELFGFLVVIHAERGALWILKEDEDGQPVRVEISPEELERVVRSGARVIVALPPRGDGPGGTIRFGERGAVPKGERAPPFGDREREAIFARDGGRCVACDSTEGVRAHHGEARADGGSSDAENGSSACTRCHGFAHDGFLNFVAEGGVLVAVGRDGKPVRSPLLAADALEGGAEDASAAETPLEVIEKEGRPAGAAQPEARGPEAAEPPRPEEVSSVDELPDAIDARTWTELSGRMDWSPSKGAFVLHPERPPAPRAERREPPGPAAPSARKEASAESAGAPPAAESPARPRSFEEFVGEGAVVANLKLLVRSAEGRGGVPGHVLLGGPAGLGKTTLAALLARERASRLKKALAAGIEPQSLVSLLGRLRRGDVLFLDEIHRLEKASEETLYSALEDGYVETMVADANAARARPLRIVLEPFTLVGATTKIGTLSESFRARFALVETLDRYEKPEIARIVERVAERYGLELEEGAAEAIAERARGVPREGIRLLERTRDLVQVAGRGSISARDVEETRAMLGMDEEGLLRTERRILELLEREGRPLGIEAIAAHLDSDRLTLEVVDEPWLLREGLVRRTERGREITERGRRVLRRALASEAHALA